MIRMITLILLTFLFLQVVAQNRQNPPTKRIYRTRPVNSSAPRIDGVGSDACWQAVPAEGNFLQREPEEGAPPSEQTYFKITYDDKNLYVLIRAQDNHPEQITYQVARRDDGEDADRVGIILDSYFDHLTAFEFGVNVSGVRMDVIWTEDGGLQDDSWDPVWQVKTTVDDSGWTAEMQIPFSQLRYPDKPEQVWGLEVYRYLHRRQEYSVWQFIPRDASGMVHLFGELHGLKNLPRLLRLELLPYTVGKIETAPTEEGNPFSVPQRNILSGGLDGKVGLTSDLTLDFTVNPDFGQVEADPSVVNLTAFETFFEEKRPFFIEGRNILDFRLGVGDGDFAREKLFYSRRIGGRPHYYPDLNDNEYVDFPENTTIISALKMTGKTRTGVSLGVLEAVTAEETAPIDSAGKKKNVVVEPLTNYFIGRFQKDFQKGNTILGGMFTATHRRINRDYLQFLNKSAYTGGVDFSHQWREKTYFFDFKGAYSYIRGHSDALLEVQTAPAHYFQRPDADYLNLDSSRTSLFGHGGSISVGKGGGGHWRFAVGGVWRSPGLELNDVGYLREADRLMQFTWVGYRWWTPTKLFRYFSINFNQWNGWNFGGEKLFTGGNINGGAQFVNYWSFWAGINRNGPGLSLTELRGGPALRYEGNWNGWFHLESDERKPVIFRMSSFFNRNDDGISHSREFNLGFEWRPVAALQMRLSPWYSESVDNLQYINEIEWESSARYIFGRVHQKTFGTVIRLNFSFTPNFSLQYYGQPFISGVQYDHLKRITNPRARNYSDRFHEFTSSEIAYDEANEIYRIDENRDGIVDYTLDRPDFTFRQFRSNLVLRWEYKPGSTIYLVWSQGRTDVTSEGTFQFGRDMRHLFDTESDNVFLLKINHWFML